MSRRLLPKTFQKLTVQKLSTNFREATVLETVDMPEVDGTDVVVETRYVGINASDRNWTAGRYTPGVEPPFDCGFESVGIVAAVGNDVTRVSVGQPVATLTGGTFTEYQIVDQRSVIPVQQCSPDVLPLLVSGLTAAISLDKMADFQHSKSDVMLVTAAAGGTGQFAVQYGKLAGCHVIGTCSSKAKADFLKSIGCDRVVDYKKEDLHTVLRDEYDDGVDVVYECVGGDMFEAALNNLAVGGRLITIGSISTYTEEHMWGTRKSKTPISLKLLSKSASLRGFFLNHFIREWKKYVASQEDLLRQGKIVSRVDLDHGFTGVEGIAGAIDHMYKGANVGKVVVPIVNASKTIARL